MISSKSCSYCEKEITGRSDKRFCDAQCRNSFNNKMVRSKERMIMAVNSQIRRNRSILKTLCPTGKATIRKQVLLDLGFSFQYFSTMYPVKNRKYYFSYEYGFCPIIEKSSSEMINVQKVVIIQKQDYMNIPFDPWK